MSTATGILPRPKNWAGIAALVLAGAVLASVGTAYVLARLLLRRLFGS